MFSKSILTVAISFLLASTAFAGDKNWQGKVNDCRAFVNGEINFYTDNASDCGGNRIVFTSSNASVTMQDRFLALCMSALTANKTLRVDYMNCNGSTAYADYNSTVQLLK